MAEVASAFVSLMPSAKGFGSKLDSQISGDVTKSGKSAGAKFGGALKLGAVAALGGAAVAVGFLKGSLDEAREAQKVGALTASTIKATGGAAKVTAKQVSDLAGAISLKTGIDDETIQSGQNMLLTFKEIRNETGKGNDIFNQATKTLVDMSAAMGSDPKKAAIQLGKALNDPIKGVSALSKVGVTFTDGQKKQIKSLVESGHAMTAQKIILKELNSEFGGAAEAQATAGDKAKVAFGNLQEAVGTALLPIIDKVLNAFTAFAVFLTTRGGPALFKVQGFFSSLGGRAGAGGLLTSLLGLGNSIRANFVPTLQAVGRALQPLAAAIGGFLGALAGAAAKVVPALLSIGRALLPVAKAAAGAAIAALVVAFRGLAPVASAAGSALAAVGNFAAEHTTSFRIIAGVITAVFVPALVAMGVAAVASAAQTAAAWVMMQAKAVAGAVAQSGAALAVVAGWVSMAVAAVASGAETAAIWLLLKADAIAGVAAQVASFAVMIAGWVSAGVAATASALVMAAAWVIALGPIALLVAAVIAAVVLVIVYWDQIKAATLATWNAIKAATVATWNALKSAVTTAVGAVVGFVKAHWKLLVAIIGGPLVAMVMLVISNWGRIKAATSAAWNAIKAVVSAAAHAVVAYIGFWASLPGKVRGWFGQITSAIRSKIGEAVGIVKGLPGKITGAIGNLGHLLYNAGSAVIQGLIDGVTSKIRALTDKLHAVTNLIPKHKGPIDKDKKLLEPAGKAIMDGLIKGLEKREQALKDKLASITQKLADVKNAAKDFSASVAQNFTTDAMGGTLADLRATLTTDTNNAKVFAAALKAAVGKGLSGALLNSVAASGNIGLAQEIAGQSKKGIADLEQQFAARANAAAAPGAFASNELFGDQIREQTNEIKGLRKDLAAVLRKERAIHVHDKSGDPKRTARDVARREAFAGGH